MKRTALGWIASILTLISLLFSALLGLAAGDGADIAGVCLILPSLILHIIFFMSSKPSRPSVQCLTSSILFFTQGVWLVLWVSVYDATGFVLLLPALCAAFSTTSYLFYLIFSIHRLRGDTTRRDIKSCEKAYAKIAKFHEYYQKGIITEEEYNKNRQHILDALKIKN